MMKIDDLRSHVLVSWIVGVVVCCATFIVAAATHYAGLTFPDIGAPVRHLFAAVGPTLIALVGTYFSGDLNAVTLKAGQRRVLFLLSYAYVVSFTFITFAMLFIDGFGLDQDATDHHAAVDHYLLLTYVQPLVVAPLFFLFGKGSRRSPKTAD